MNLPNKLTIFRIILVPIMIIIPFINIQGSVYGIPITWIIIDLIFILAAITDELDGYIARSRNQITTFGKFLDPIADKILVLTAMIMLVESNNRIPAVIPVIVLFREFVVSGYRLVAAGKQGKVIAASMLGKIKTTTQMMAVTFALIDMNPIFKFVSGELTGASRAFNALWSILMVISVIATIISGINYVKDGKELFKGEM